MWTANILTMEKIETSLTVTEVNMDTFLDAVGTAVVGLKFFIKFYSFLNNKFRAQNSRVLASPMDKKV